MKGSTTPATKGDLAQLRNELRDALDRRLANLDPTINSCKDDILRHFDLVADALREDLTGTIRDAIESSIDQKEDHERRIQRLERDAGFRPVA